MRIADFDYDLPAELIAQEPLAERDASRMMVVRRTDGAIFHRRFIDLPGFVAQGDLLVLNDVRVVPAKIWGKRDGATIEFLFVKEERAGVWEVLCKPSRRVRTGDRIVFGPGFEAVVSGAGSEGRRSLTFSVRDVLAKLREAGFAPLPPYIKRKKADAGRRPADLDRYQTIYAARGSAIAAPTAGLHFTPQILESLTLRSTPIAKITLDVGPATFQPVRAARVEDHRMLEETYHISEEASDAINAAKAGGRTIVAGGTTTVRALESAGRSGRVVPGPGSTSLFITPGYEFKIIDRLLTNFHLPQSTLLMLVSALAGRELILSAYQEAVRERYRFYSYGDCMLIL